jgi:hypothetical protein
MLIPVPTTAPAPTPADDEQEPLPPPEGGIPKDILHIARQQLQHAYYLTPYYIRDWGQKNVYYDSFTFDDYEDDELTLRGYWIGEGSRVNSSGEVQHQSPLDTYVFFATGKADGDIPALMAITLGRYPKDFDFDPIGFPPDVRVPELNEYYNVYHDRLYVLLLVIPFPEGATDPDLWNLYMDFFLENIQGYWDNGDNSRYRKADMGLVKIPFFPGEEWDVGSTTPLQQAQLDEMLRIMRKEIDERGNIFLESGITHPGEFIIYTRWDYAMMNLYVTRGWITEYGPQTFFPLMDYTTFLRYSLPFPHSAWAFLFPEGNQSVDEYKGEYHPVRTSGVFEIELARGVLKPHVVIVDP